MPGKSTSRRRVFIATLVSLALVALIVVLLVRREGGFPCGLLAAAGDAFGCAGDETAQDGDDYRLVDPELRRTDIESILSLPYVSGTTPATGSSGVVQHVEGRTWQGLNLYTSNVDSFQTYLIDMNGRIAHTWHTELPYWVVSELLPDGSLIGVFEDVALVKMDRDSRVQWKIDTRAHHSVQRLATGEIVFLSRESRPRPEVHPTIDTLDDFIVKVSADGDERLRISILDCILSSRFAFLLPVVNDLDFRTADNPDPEIDILHTNHAEVIEASDDLSDPFVPGRIIVSLRNLSTVGIIDPQQGRMVWAWGPPTLVNQHQPTLLENGNLLIFNNGAYRSEIIEFDPAARGAAWRFRQDGFFSGTSGSAQRLPNGNTLITDSNAGRVIEVTAAGEIVWEFLNPLETEAGKRQTIYRMTRYDADELAFGSFQN